MRLASKFLILMVVFMLCSFISIGWLKDLFIVLELISCAFSVSFNIRDIIKTKKTIKTLDKEYRILRDELEKLQKGE